MNSFKIVRVLTLGARNRIGLDDPAASRKVKRELQELQATPAEQRDKVALEVADVVYFLVKAVFCGQMAPSEADEILKKHLPPWMDEDFAIESAITKYQFRAENTKNHYRERELIRELFRSRRIPFVGPAEQS